MTKYYKTAFSHEQHIEHWQERGLVIKAIHYLSVINYYRLSAYTLPFQLENPKHQKNTKFEDVLDLYVFDRELRLLVMDAIERIEAAIHNLAEESLLKTLQLRRINTPKILINNVLNLN